MTGVSGHKSATEAPPDTRALAIHTRGVMKSSFQSPQSADYVRHADMAFRVADRDKAMIWRFNPLTSKADQRELDAHLTGCNRTLVTLSVWASADALFEYSYATLHGKMLARRSDWFEDSETSSYVLWWVSPSERPSLADAGSRLTRYASEGDSEFAFGWSWLGRERPH